MNDFVIERDPVTDKKVNRFFTNAEQLIFDTPPTQAELDAKKNAKVDGFQRGNKGLLDVMFKMYDLLAVAGIEGFPPLTPAQKREFIKATL